MNTDRHFTNFSMQRFVAFVLALYLLPGLAVGGLLSERTYKRLGQIHKLVDKSDYSGALGRLDKLMLQSGGRAYDKAIIQQTYGYVYESMGQPARAVEAFKSSLESGELSSTVVQGIRINLASLYFSLGKSKKALSAFVAWYEDQKKPTPQALVFGGSLYAENNEYNKAISLINKAISISRNPKEAWYRRIAAIYVKMEDFSNASRVLSILVEKNPSKVSYWKQLSASYYFAGDEENALSVMLLAYEKLLLKTEKEIIDLARLAASQNIPIRASRIMEIGLNEGVVNRNGKHMELLGNIYIQAKEYHKAIESFTHAADLSKEPELYLRVANLYSDRHQWESVLSVLNEHLPEEPHLKTRGLLLKGIALYETGKVEESRHIFQKVSSQKESAKLASTWLEYIDLYPVK